MSSAVLAASLFAGLAKAVLYPAIDQTLKPSYATQPNISYVDISLSTYDRIVLNYNGAPFFYNGIQIRADNLYRVWNMTNDQIGVVYKSAASAGFTVANTQFYWSDLQPDTSYVAHESTYIQGGIEASKNFASTTVHNIGYSSTNTSGQSLLYLKFDFRDYSIDQIDGAKLRFYVTANATGNVSFTANLYGIKNDTWTADTITWNNAPNHNGINISGVNGTDYWGATSNPSWDPILKASYYDIDASDYIINHCSNKIASFILQPQVNQTGLTNGATIYGALSVKPPTLWISSTQSWNYTYLETLIGWAEDAALNLELIWFGSDSSGATMDSRVPYFVYRHVLVEKTQTDGSVVPLFVKNTGSVAYGVYWYMCDKNDFSLRKLEKAAIKNMMNHIAVYNTASGNKKTVIGVDVNNEGEVITIHEGTGGGTVYQNPATWSALPNFTSAISFEVRTMWEHEVNLANGVKESNYPVWTRSNSNSGSKAPNMPFNEHLRAAGGTSVDFCGLDPYVTNNTILWMFGHEINPLTDLDSSYGFNLPMVMENGGSYTNTEWLILSTLAGGGYYNVYDMMSFENYGLYLPANRAAGNYTPIPRASYVAGVVSTNTLLKSLGQDLATKRPNGAGGTDLVYFNALDAGTNLTDSLWSIPVTYSPTAGGVGIGVVRSGVALLFASTRAANFSLSEITSYGISSVQHGSYSGANWVSAGSYPYTTSGNSVTIQMTQDTLVHVELSNPMTK
jgi:Domain of unknown function (DUF4978)